MFLKNTSLLCLFFYIWSSEALEPIEDVSSSQNDENIPMMYVNESILQHQIASNILTKFLPNMSWESNEIVLDVGCGPGDVTKKRLYSEIQDQIEKLIAVDRNEEMIKFAKHSNEITKIEFKTMNIEDSISSSFYSNHFNKIFSFMCFHWVSDKPIALKNIYLMLKFGGEILMTFLTNNPFFQMYKILGPDFDEYVKKIMPEPVLFIPKEEMKSYFETAGFRVIEVYIHNKSIEYLEIKHFIDAVKSADSLYSNIPINLRERYFSIIKENFWNIPELTFCNETGKITYNYSTYVIHAIKEKL
ncbi:juvenile hormone acid O-methyltransferase-like [Daktulosphaira vitifoliae]|uniref:juvenile hormone acid O-methyltransferase-like n=1 Tax=Daktulosphaira vitifoliae TaxID=58002 RepID=UPI0021A9B4A5|nr:juvenile hormone acid O-methyltransferase-like [Daktulosphaira vitifoliae]